MQTLYLSPHFHGSLTLVDMDDICISNTNRQLPSRPVRLQGFNLVSCVRSVVGLQGVRFQDSGRVGLNVCCTWASGFQFILLLQIAGSRVQQVQVCTGGFEAL